MNAIWSVRVYIYIRKFSVSARLGINYSCVCDTTRVDMCHRWEFAARSPFLLVGIRFIRLPRPCKKYCGADRQALQMKYSKITHFSGCFWGENFTLRGWKEIFPFRGTGLRDFVRKAINFVISMSLDL